MKTFEVKITPETLVFMVEAETEDDAIESAENIFNTEFGRGDLGIEDLEAVEMKDEL